MVGWLERRPRGREVQVLSGRRKSVFSQVTVCVKGSNGASQAAALSSQET